MERDLHYDMTDAERRIHNTAMLGQVVELDALHARVRVQAGPITTGWLPFVTLRAGEDRTWHPPEPGEQVLLVAPGGELNQAVVVGSIYRADHPAPATAAHISRTVYQDGAVMEYDRQGHHWRLAVPTGGSIRFEIGGTALELRADGTRLTTPALLVDSPDSTFTGTVLIKKMLTYLKGLIGKGGGGGGAACASIEGDIQVMGNINASGSVIDGGGNTNHHSH